MNLPTLNAAKRIFDFLRAKLTGDWWVECPVCGDGISGHTAYFGGGVDHRHDGSGGSSYRLVCRKPSCVAEATIQTRGAYSKACNEVKF